jgi:hypothetical protein
MIFQSFSSSLSIRDELVESSSDSCNILPETVTHNTPSKDHDAGLISLRERFRRIRTPSTIILYP